MGDGWIFGDQPQFKRKTAHKINLEKPETLSTLLRFELSSVLIKISKSIIIDIEILTPGKECSVISGTESLPSSAKLMGGQLCTEIAGQ